MNGADAIAIIVLLIILIAIGVYLLHWLYRHSSKDQSFVRTGFGGERVVMGGGAFVVPIIHNLTLVNMTAVPIEIRRSGEQSLITGNKMRVDMTAEYFVRVIASAEGVATAARTLGHRTADPTALKEVIQGRFADAMGAVAATMTMEEIHANRAVFMQKVSETASRTLASNGLELETAAMTSLNQTDISVFNPANAFDAEGLTQLTQEVEERRRLRNQIENDTKLQIKLKDYETEQRALEIDRDLEYARIAQAQAVEIRRQTQLSQIEQEKANARIAIANAKVRADQEAESFRIQAEQQIEADRISSDQRTRSLDIERAKSLELLDITSQQEMERSRIQTRQQIEAQRAEEEAKTKAVEIQTRQDIALFDVRAMAQVEQARLDQEQEVETRRIETQRQIRLLGIDTDQQINVTAEKAQAETQQAEIMRAYLVNMERLKKDEEINRQEITKNQAVKLAETQAFRQIEDASIIANREIEEMRVAARRYVERFEIEQQKEVEIVDKERLIAVINKTIEEAVARTEHAKAERSLAETQEKIATAKATEIANRSKSVEMIEAQSRVDREALRLTRIAEAEREASDQRAQAEITQANAAEVRYAKDAEGRRLLNESENLRSEASRKSAVYENLIANLPSIIREMVKPMENIDSIKILQVDGLPGLNSPTEMGGGGGDGEGGGSVSDRVVSSAMKYRTQVAFVDGLMKEIGLPLDNLGSAGGMSFRNFPGNPPPKGKDDD